MYKETKPPCYGCTKRYTGCHAKCLDYSDWANEHKAFLEEKRKAQETSRKLTDAEIKRHLKIKHAKKNKRSFGR